MIITLERKMLVMAAVLLAYSIALLQLPLLNYLGYEYAVAVAMAVPIVSGYLVISGARSRCSQGEKITAALVRSVIRTSLTRSYVLLALPFVAATVNLIFVRNCSFGNGIIFYMLIPCITCFWSTSVAGFCVALTSQSLPSRVSRTIWLYLLLLGIVLVYPLYLGYATPQIYSYNFIYGFFPGFSYDETMRITAPLIIFRYVTLVMSILLLLGSELLLLRRNGNAGIPPRGMLTTIASFLSVLLFLAWMFRVDLGFESSATYLQHSLGSRYTSEHFHIYYSRSNFTEDEIRYVAAMHEFRLRQVTSMLQAYPSGRITSYIYPTIEMKRRFIGTGNTNIAKPWRKEIHLNKDSWEDVLRHELVHVVAGEFGMPVIRAHYNIGLVEGLATAIDGDFGNRTLEEYASAVLKFGIVAQPGRLIRPAGFAAQSSTISYVLMGAFCRFLIDRYGIVKFKGLYGGSSVEEVYNMPYEKLVEQWQHLLERVEVPDSSRRHIEYYFKRPSIFARQCARTVANMNEDASKYLEKNDFVAGMNMYRSALSTSWNTESFAGLVRSAFNAGRYDSVVEWINKQMEDSSRRSGIVNLYLLYGDAAWYRDDCIAARSVDEEILALDLSERYTEAAAIRLAVLNIQLLRTKLPAYFVGAMSDSSARLLLDTLLAESPNPIIPYLKAKLLLRQRNYADAIRALGSIDSGLHNRILDVRREQLLGEAFFMLRQYERARIHFWQSLNYLTEKSSIDRVNDWIARCEWFEKYGDRYLKH